MALSIPWNSTTLRSLPRLRRWNRKMSLLYLPPCRPSVRATLLPPPRTEPPHGRRTGANYAAPLDLLELELTRTSRSATPSHIPSSCLRGPLARSRTSQTGSTRRPCPAPCSLLCRSAPVMRGTAAILEEASHQPAHQKPDLEVRNCRRGGPDSQSRHTRVRRRRLTPQVLSDLVH
jgi:hypothetical protein